MDLGRTPPLDGNYRLLVGPSRQIPLSREPALAGQASITPILCPDNCLIEIIAAIDASVDSLEVSAQYLDVDWYWGRAI